MLELVAGDTLAERLAAGPLGIDEALGSRARSRKRWRRPMREESSTEI